MITGIQAKASEYLLMSLIKVAFHMLCQCINTFPCQCISHIFWIKRNVSSASWMFQALKGVWLTHALLQCRDRYIFLCFLLSVCFTKLQCVSRIETVTNKLINNVPFPNVNGTMNYSHCMNGRQILNPLSSLHKTLEEYIVSYLLYGR